MALMHLMSDATRPVYLKLRDMIAAAIIEGRYREGEMLPSVRAFAAEQGANPLTVAPGAAERLRDSERRRFLEHEWPAIRARMDRLDIDTAALLDDA